MLVSVLLFLVGLALLVKGGDWVCRCRHRTGPAFPSA